jgi:hypothetical protein
LVVVSKDIDRDHSARTNQNRGEKKKVTRTTALRKPPTTQTQRVACRTRLCIALAGSDHIQRARARQQTGFFSSHVQNKHPTYMHTAPTALPSQTKQDACLKPLLSCVESAKLASAAMRLVSRRMFASEAAASVDGPLKLR